MPSQQGKLTFSGHHSFVLRFAWLPKVAALLPTVPDLFARDDALVLLGVGKNMVNAIEHWSVAAGIIAPSAETAGHFTMTALGSHLFREDGWDPYLEDHATLWLLHWQLVKRPTAVATWHLTFTCYPRAAFSRDELAAWLFTWATETSSTRATRQSIKRDVDVFVRTYLPKTDLGRRPAEDSFDSPLAQLGLLEEVESGLYRMRTGMQPTLPQEVLASAILEYWDRVAPTQSTLAAEQLLHGPGSPGRAFQLVEAAFIERLEQLPKAFGLHYDQSAGMRRLVRHRQLRDDERLSLLSTAFVRQAVTTR